MDIILFFVHHRGGSAVPRICEGIPKIKWYPGSIGTKNYNTYPRQKLKIIYLFHRTLDQINYDSIIIYAIILSNRTRLLFTTPDVTEPQKCGNTNRDLLCFDKIIGVKDTQMIEWKILWKSIKIKKQNINVFRVK